MWAPSSPSRFVREARRLWLVWLLPSSVRCGAIWRNIRRFCGSEGVCWYSSPMMSIQKMPLGAGVCGRSPSSVSTTVNGCRIPCLSVCWTRLSAAVCKISSASSWIRSGIVCGFTTWEKSTKAKSSTLVASRHTFRKIQ